MDFSDTIEIKIDLPKNLIIRIYSGFKIQFGRNNSPLFIVLDELKEIWLSRNELNLIGKNSCHPKSELPLSILQRTSQEDCDEYNLEELQEIE